MKYVAPRELTAAGSIHLDLRDLGLDRNGDTRPRFAGEVVDVARYLDIREQFQALADRSAEPNVFAEPDLVAALAHARGTAASTRIALAWTAENPRKLVGALPFHVEKASPTRPFALLSARGHAYTVLSTPTLDKSCAKDVLSTMLSSIFAMPSMPRVLALPFMADRGPAMAALENSVSACNLRMHVFERYERARLDARDGGAEAFMAARFEGRKRKKHRQERRKLEEAGGTFTRHRGLDAREAFEELLALEAASWKGRRGSAIVCDPVDATFMRRAVGALADRGLAEVHALRLNGKAIALGLVLKSGGGAWYHKVAFDEAHARLSPGTEMSLELTLSLLEEPGFRFADSCALRGGGLLTGSWTDAQPIADVLIDLTPGGARLFGLVVAWETGRRRLREIAKAAYHRLKGAAR